MRELTRGPLKLLDDRFVLISIFADKCAHNTHEIELAFFCQVRPLAARGLRANAASYIHRRRYIYI